MTAHRPNHSQGAQSLRLIFSYDGEEIRLESRQPVTMLAPPSELVDDDGKPRFWTDVRDARGTVLHRQTMHDPVRRFVEVYPEDPAEPITYAPVAQPRGAFALLVPLLDGADHVAVMGIAAAGTTGPTSSVELHRVSLLEARS